MLLTTVKSLLPGATIRLRLDGGAEETWDVTSKTPGGCFDRLKLGLRRSGNIVRDVTLDGAALVELVPPRFQPSATPVPAQPRPYAAGGAQNDQTDFRPTDFRELLLQFMGSLTLAEDMGAVHATMTHALRQAGVMVDWDDVDDLRRALATIGTTTLDGGSLGEGA